MIVGNFIKIPAKMEQTMEKILKTSLFPLIPLLVSKKDDISSF